MKRTPGGSSSSNRFPGHVTLRLRRLAVAAVGGAVVVVTATSQVGADTVTVVPAAAPAADTAGTASTDYWAAPTELPQPATLSAAKPAVERAARALAGRDSARTVAAISAPGEADLTDIPAPALAAYQRAAAVIDEAMPSCALDWELLAAIGRVESDHGRVGGGALSARGVAEPAIIGVALTGGDGTRQITDSDAGALDGDRVFDRAVGPMQFIPTTWSVVGVDADGDGERNPQDVDDAALAAAVYLCGDGEDLSTDAGRESAVLTYNRSDSYVATVLALREAYAEGRPATIVPAVSTVQVGGGSTTATPDGAAPLTGQAQEVADQQRVADEREAAAAGAAPRGGDRDRADRDRTSSGKTVRQGADDAPDLDSTGENVVGGGTAPTPAPGGGEGGGDTGIEPTPGPGTQPAPEPGTEPAPEPGTEPAPEPGTAPTQPAPPTEPVIACATDEFPLADGTVLLLEDLLADPLLYEDAAVLDELTGLGFVPLCTTVDAGSTP